MRNEEVFLKKIKKNTANKEIETEHLGAIQRLSLNPMGFTELCPGMPTDTAGIRRQETVEPAKSLAKLEL